MLQHADGRPRPMCLSDVRALLRAGADRGPQGVDWSGMNRVYGVTPDHALVDAGATWRALLQATLPRGLTPACLPTSPDLMVCQTLRLGDALLRGGACEPRDPIDALHLMTPDGLIVCSHQQHPDAFDACRAGQGPRGQLVVRVLVRLQDAPTYVRRARLFYRDARRLDADVTALRAECRFDCLQAVEMSGAERAQNAAWLAVAGHPPGACEPRFMIEAVACFDPGDEPPMEALLSVLPAPPDGARTDTLPFCDYALEHAPGAHGI